MSETDIITALKSGIPVPAQRVMELRSKGMHDIRFELVHQLLRSGVWVNTISVYWEGQQEFLKQPMLHDTDRKLVVRQRTPVAGLFKDLWLIGYSEDAEIRRLVDAEIARMLEGVVAQSSASV